VTVPDAVHIQLNLLKMSIIVLETCIVILYEYRYLYIKLVIASKLVHNTVEGAQVLHSVCLSLCVGSDHPVRHKLQYTQQLKSMETI